MFWINQQKHWKPWIFSEYGARKTPVSCDTCLIWSLLTWHLKVIFFHQKGLIKARDLNAIKWLSLCFVYCLVQVASGYRDTDKVRFPRTLWCWRKTLGLPKIPSQPPLPSLTLPVIYISQPASSVSILLDWYLNIQIHFNINNAFIRSLYCFLFVNGTRVQEAFVWGLLPCIDTIGRLPRIYRL